MSEWPYARFHLTRLLFINILDTIAVVVQAFASFGKMDA
jgi:hypothetical protein